MKEEREFLNGKRILWVDDEPEVPKTLEDLRVMCNVKKASSFDQAKEMLETQDFDMAILDTMSGKVYELFELANETNVMAVMLNANGFNDNDTVISYRVGSTGITYEDYGTGMNMDSNTALLDTQKKDRHPWWRWLDWLGNCYEKSIGSDWVSYEEFWELVLKEKYDTLR